ncbi:non-homologous end-joining factor 1-like [Octopus vulgaris]|uniref:Non-homologous end-joining factor 1 n=1 Tax=Octopus vulgaris TaxID=6645 RepID=A0AA36ANC3_OCTVU|nr:non-homologous end-joining factor 1-like [Octopus vulgaris]
MDLETKWRSLWKPDLKCCPWRILQADEYVYLIKTRFGENCYECMITDLTNYWCESLTERECCQRLQELNPNLEAPISKILEHIKLNIDKNPSDNLRISKDDKGTMHIWINSKLSRFPFTWQLVGEPAHEEMVSENMTIPLLMMVSELNRRQRELIHIISKKDLEIEDYRAQSVKLNQKQLATVYFDETSFGNNMVLSKEFEDNVKLLGTTAFESYGQDLYRQIMTKYTWLHKCSKADPETFEITKPIEESSNVFTELAELSTAVEEHEQKVNIGPDIYDCNQCIFSTSSQELLLHHVSMYHRDSALNINANFDGQLQQTVLADPLPLFNAGNISCPQCGQHYKTQYGLQSHMNSKHLGKFLFNCSICGRGFDSFWTYKAHIDKHHILEEKCDRCNLTFRFKKSLLSHKRFCGRTKHHGGDTSDDNESSQCAYKAGGPSWLNGTSYLDKKEPVKNEVEICPLVTSPSMTEILEKEKEDARRKELRQRLLLDKKKRGSKVRKRAA